MKKLFKTLIAMIMMTTILSSNAYALVSKNDFSFVPIKVVNYYLHSLNGMLFESKQRFDFPNDIHLMGKYHSVFKPKKYQGQFGGPIVIPYAINDVWINGMEIVEEIDGRTIRYGYKNSNGENVIPVMCEMIMPFYEDIARARIDGKYGFFNKEGKVEIPFIYDFIWDFDYDNITPACIDDKYGYIDRQNNTVLPFEYYFAMPFIDDTAVISMKTQEGYVEKGIINRNGEVIIPANYYEITRMENGLFLVSDSKRYGIYNKEGKEILPMEYTKINEFKEEVAIVEKDGIFGAINVNGEEVVPLKYKKLGAFSEGLAAANLDNKWGFLDKNNNTVIPFIYDDVRQFGDGLAAVRLEEKEDEYKQWGFINREGEVIIPFKYWYPGVFSDGRALIGPEGSRRSGDGQYRIIDKSGNELIKEEGGVEEYFINGVGYVSLPSFTMAKPDYSAMIANNGDIICVSYNMSEFKDGSYFVTNGFDYDLLIDKRYIPISVNNRIIKTDQNPINVNGRVLCPVRVIMENLDCIVEWNQETQGIFISDSEKAVVLTIGEKKMTIKNKTGEVKEIVLDVAPVIKEGRTMVPIRAVAEQFGSEVHWDGTLNTVKLIK